MANRSKNGGRALITGASGGIGLELAREFAAHGHSVILVARNEARLNEVAAELVHTYAVEANVIASDLGERSAPHALFGEVARRNLEVDSRQQRRTHGDRRVQGRGYRDPARHHPAQRRGADRADKPVPEANGGAG
jgi:NAD(P)-dependent dehydrogenase (short-subunit alcohol dehydrogenase family)